jgi:hypothetical protein
MLRAIVRAQDIDKQLQYWSERNTKENLFGDRGGGGVSQPPMLIALHGKTSVLPDEWHTRHLGWKLGMVCFVSGACTSYGASVGKFGIRLSFFSKLTFFAMYATIRYAFSRSNMTSASSRKRSLRTSMGSRSRGRSRVAGQSSGSGMHISMLATQRRGTRCSL